MIMFCIVCVTLIAAIGISEKVSAASKKATLETREKKIKLEDEKPVQTVSKKEIVESEEDRAAILALIAMGGE